jgi:hypothetical protein
MIWIGLERFFQLPIIPAPKRNSKLHNEMWTNPFFAEGVWARGPSARRFTWLRRATRALPISQPNVAALDARTVYLRLAIWDDLSCYSGDTRNRKCGNDLIPKAEFGERETCARTIQFTFGTSLGKPSIYHVTAVP